MRRQLRVGIDRDLHFALKSPKDSTAIAKTRDGGANLVKRLFFYDNRNRATFGNN
jgi:hypothetical protein